MGNWSGDFVGGARTEDFVWQICLESCLDTVLGNALEHCWGKVESKQEINQQQLCDSWTHATGPITKLSYTQQNSNPHTNAIGSWSARKWNHCLLINTPQGNIIRKKERMCSDAHYVDSKRTAHAVYTTLYSKARGGKRAAQKRRASLR